MKSKTLERTSLLLLVLYCGDLLWKLAHWSVFSGRLPWWSIALALSVRFTVMGGLLYLFLRARKAARVTP
jgi:hypothetical protein